MSQTVRDVDRRKRNVIISGLSENETAQQDAETVIDFAGDVFHLDLRSNIINCKRIGDITLTFPRRLLMTRNSAATVSELLLRAPKLRDIGNGYLANNVYINHDLSREEAKEAYMRRQERRERLADENSQGAYAQGPYQTRAKQHQRKVFYRRA